MITIHSSTDDVVQYLNTLRLFQHTFADVAPVFKEECVDGVVLLNLQKGDLSQLGIVQFARRNTFFQHIIELRGRQSNGLQINPTIDSQIDSTPTFTDDDQYYNVEFAGLTVNGWPQTFLMTKREIKSGEELMTYYGDEFASALTMKADADRQKMRRKQRIDKHILGGLKL